MEYTLELNRELIEEVIGAAVELHPDGGEMHPMIREFVEQAIREKLDRLNPIVLAELVDAAVIRKDVVGVDLFIARIKAHRIIMHTGLKESKDWVEAHFDNHGTGAILRS